MGQPTNDYDIEVYDIDPDDFNDLMLKWGAIGVGKSFFVYRKGFFDISLPRTESKVSFGHKGFEVRVTNDEKEASRRRDFTINSLMVNVLTGEILDFYGGQKDIKNKILRMVDPMTFVEDSLRVLRGVGFVARFDLSIENETLTLCQSILLDDLSPQRVTQELLKIEKGSFEKGLKTAFELKVFDRLLDHQHPLSSTRRDELISIASRSLEGCSFLSALIWVLKESYHPNFGTIEKIFSLSRDEKKLALYQKCIPQVITDRFLIAMAERFPLKRWVGSYGGDTSQRAKKLAIWDQKIEPIDHNIALEIGLLGKDIGIYCNNKRRERIRSFKGTK
jgi:tRNA nucleotidyltransferase (CCA-adding enzyme)